MTDEFDTDDDNTDDDAPGLRKLRYWNTASHGSVLTRTVVKENINDLAKEVKKAVGACIAAGKPFEIAVNGLEITYRLAGEGGKADAAVRKAANKLAPVTEEEKAARREIKAARQAGPQKSEAEKAERDQRRAAHKARRAAKVAAKDEA